MGANITEAMARAAQKVISNDKAKEKRFNILVDLLGGTGTTIEVLVSCIDLLPRGGAQKIKLSTFTSQWNKLMMVECRFQQITADLKPAEKKKVMLRLSEAADYRLYGNMSNMSKELMWAICGKVRQEVMPNRIRSRFTFDKGTQESWSTQVERIVYDAVTKNVATIYEIFDTFNQDVNFYENCSVYVPGKKAAHAFRRINHDQIRENPMHLEPLPICGHELRVRINHKADSEATLHKEAFEVIRNMRFTLDKEFNRVLEAFVADTELFNSVVVGKKIMSKMATKAVINAYTSTIKQSIHDWDEIGNQPFYSKWVQDWRGRVYQQGDATAITNKAGKAMLRSAVGTALGEDGYERILMSLASAMGMDKEIFKVRLTWGREHEAQYIKIGHRLRNVELDAMKELIELGADDVFQAMVCCIELAKIDAYVGKTEDFVSNIFIGYDGSCSGLQNIGCLTRSKLLREATNVYVDDNTEDKIHDVYKVLLGEMIEECTNELKIVEDPIALEANSLFLGLDAKQQRKICKSLLMKRSYGALFMTMRDSVYDVIHTAGCVEDKKQAGEYARILANTFVKVYNTGKTFSAAKNYEALTKAIAEAYSKTGADMTWSIKGSTTTYGEQEIKSNYRTSTDKQVTILIQKASVVIRRYEVDYLSNPRACSDIAPMVHDSKRTKSGACPNLTHSCDSYHLLATVMNMQEMANDGSAYALTHDCFGVTAGNAKTLLKALNKSWVDMYADHKTLEQIVADCNARTGSKLSVEDFGINGPENMKESLEKAVYSFS